jgi:hypothetical protein
MIDVHLRLYRDARIARQAMGGGAGDAGGALSDDGEAGAEGGDFTEERAGADGASGGLGGDLEDSEAALIGECDGASEQVGAAHQFGCECEVGYE